MHKTILLLLCLFASTLCFSQTITLKGKITDPDDSPLESATIYLTSVKDSSVVDYTISNKNGSWELKTKKIEQPVFLKVSFIGFADYKQQLTAATEDKDFGTVKLAAKSTELDEIVIESEIPPIRIKSDTLEFNASSFKVRPDANVEALLKQLPGVEIDSDGKITVNGKEVNQILVNGKPFFDKDGKIALQNLPAEIINKVQVTDTKTKQEELAGKTASSNNASINLTIDPDKNKGLFGKFMAGYGSNQRYESSAMLNYFKDKRKISLLGSSNNINSVGFSMDEVFDNMGGGRNNSVSYSSNGSFNVNGRQFGGSGSGITLSNMGGLNYSDEWFEGLKSDASYFYSSASTENENRTRQVTFLPDTNPGGNGAITKSFTTESSSKTDNDRYTHNINTDFEIAIDSTATLYFAPKFTTGNSRNKSDSRQFSTNEDNDLLNENTANTVDEDENTSFSNSLSFYKSFNKKGRAISFELDNQNTKDDAKNFNKSTTISYFNDAGDPETATEVRDQVRHNRQQQDSYTTEIGYTEPITDSLNIGIALNYNRVQSLEDREGFNFDAATGGYTAKNDLLTNYLVSKTNTITPKTSIQIQKNKFYFGANLGTSITKFENFSSYLGQQTSLSKDYILPDADAYMNYRFSKSKSFYLNYSYSINFPQASQVLPVEDLSNPLATSIGNPDLSPNKTHNMYFSFRDYDYSTRSGYNVYASGNFYESQVVSSTIFDESAKRETTYTNVSGNYSGRLGINWSKSLKHEANTLRLSLGISGGLTVSKGYTNGQLFDAKTLDLTPRIGISWDYGELLTINPTYSFSYNDNHYTNYVINSASNFVHRFNLQTTSYWPKHFVWGNDFGYTYNSQIASGFRKDFYLWNTSLGYNFLNDKFLFKVKVYDLLNQNLNTTRTITATTIHDEQNIVLKRYVMFSLTYKLDKFGNAEEKKGRRGRFMMN